MFSVIETPIEVTVSLNGQNKVVQVETEQIQVVEVVQQGPAGPPGQDGVGADARYTHDQASPSLLWTVSHNLGKYPTPVIVDSAGTTVEGKITFITINQLTCEFTSLFSGKVYCN